MTDKKQKLFLTSYARNGNIAKSAKAVKLSRQTIYNEIYNDFAFKAKIEKIRKRRFTEVMETLGELLEKAVAVLADGLDDKVSWLQIKCADSIFGHYNKFKDLVELEGRLRRLEEKVL